MLAIGRSNGDPKLDRGYQHSRDQYLEPGGEEAEPTAGLKVAVEETMHPALARLVSQDRAAVGLGRIR